MPRPEEPLDPDAGPVQGFAQQLRELRRVAGRPTYRQMAERAHYSRSSLADAARGRSFPTWEVVRAFVRACDGDEADWAGRWEATKGVLAPERDEAPAPPPARAAPPPRRRRPRLPSRRPVAAVLLMPAMVLVTAGFLLVPDSGTATHSAYLGGVDLGRYCRAHGYAGASLDGPTAYDWHCRTAAGGQDDLSVIDACRRQYGRATATAHYADMDNPNSWQCWDHVALLGRVDLDAYCRSLRYSRAALEGRTAGDWRCVAAGRVDVPIDPDSACRWRYGARLRVANVLSYRAPWERWDCWG